MRKTVYVPDELIERIQAAGHDTENFSEVVQRGLQALIRTPGERPAFTRQVDLDHAERELWEATVARLVAQTQDEYKLGRRDALESAAGMGWAQLAELESYGWDVFRHAAATADRLIEEQRDGRDVNSSEIQGWLDFSMGDEHTSGPRLLGMRDTFQALHQAVFGTSGTPAGSAESHAAVIDSGDHEKG